VNTVDQTLENVAGYAPGRVSGLHHAEQMLLDSLVVPGMRVLELGCGGGRVTGPLLDRGAVVTACDLSDEALELIRVQLGGRERLEICRADARDVPFENDTFEVVFFAWNGLDWMRPETERDRVVEEAARVLTPGGRFVFSSHNPLGTLFTWRGLRSAHMWRWRLRYLVSGDLTRRYFRDPGGLLLFQASPAYVIRQVKAAGFEFDSMLGASGVTGNRLLLTAFLVWPYYVFSKPDAGST